MKRIMYSLIAVMLLATGLAWAEPWTEVAPLNVARYKHRAVVLDGKIYVIGGQAPDKMCAPVEVYDPDTNTWTVVGPGPVNCEGPHLAAMGGTLFVLAGRDLAAKARTLDGYMGTPTSEGIIWEKVPGQPTMAHGDAASGVIGNKIYLISGEDDTLTNLGDDYVQAVDVFDMATLTWSIAASIAPYGREDFDAAVVGTKIITIAGQGGPENTSLRWLNVYDAETDTWEHWEEGVPFGWEHPRAVGIGPYVYVMSGKDEGGFFNFRFDPATMTWTELTPPPEPVQQCALVALDGRIYMIGGVHFDGTILTRVFVYDPQKED